MKKIKIFVLAFMLPFLISGCEEVEHKDAMETDGEPETSLVEKIDLSAVSAPKEAAVYAATFFDRETEETARIFLGNDFEEGETVAEGRIFLHGAGTPKEKQLCVFDSGRAFFGDSRHVGDNGVNFNSRYDLCYNIIYTNDEYRDLAREYDNEGRIASGGEPDGQNGAFSDKQEQIAGYLEELGAGGYELFSAGTFPTRQGEGCLMYFKQVVDGIPVSHILFENKDKKTLYNLRYSVLSEKITALDADVRVCFLGDELVRFYCSSLIDTGRPLKEYPLVPVSDAYRKVRERYPAAAGMDGKHELERAELQYELVMPDISAEDEICLYPVWLFGVRNKGDKMAENEWTYYMVDAVTGEFFSDIPKERLQ